MPKEHPVDDLKSVILKLKPDLCFYNVTVNGAESDNTFLIIILILAVVVPIIFYKIYKRRKGD